MSESVLGLVKILNGFKESQVFTLFIDTLTSRTNPGALEPSRRSSLSTSLYSFPSEFSNPRSSVILLDALVAFVRQLELSTISEINQDCLSFLKECISNVSTYKNLLGNVLTLATVYGEKLDDSVIADKKKMRKDFGVRCLFLRSNNRIRTFAFSL